MPTLGSLVASYWVPWIGPIATLWCALALVLAGGAIALVGVREPRGRARLAPEGERVIATLLNGVSIGWRNPKIAAGCIVRTINTASQFGFFVFLPAYFTKSAGFTLSQWLRLLSFMFLSNIIWNLLFGMIGDRFGWRRTVALFGGMGCAVSTLLLYYAPVATGGSYIAAVCAAMLYGATLAAYVPLSVLMPSLAPEHKGAAMSMLNLGAGASVWVGPAIVGLLLDRAGVGGVMWTFAGLYVLSAALTLTLKLPEETARR
jgi:predicted MFS family arabinose efflux permease